MNYNNGYNQGIEKQSIPVLILLSIITCSIYYWYWMYQTTATLQRLRGQNDASPGMTVFLSIITCNIYGVYWIYRSSKAVYELQMAYGMPAPQDNSVITMVIEIVGMIFVFGGNYVAAAILQSSLNDLADYAY